VVLSAGPLIFVPPQYAAVARLRWAAGLQQGAVLGEVVEYRADGPAVCRTGHAAGVAAAALAGMHVVV